MAQLIQGRDMISFFRLHKNRATEDGTKLRFVTESTISKEKESETTITKDGPISSVMDGENSAEFTSLAYRDDVETITSWRLLEDAYDDNELVEFWNVDAGSAGEGGEVDATYHQGYFTSFEISAPADGNVELSYSYTINGKGVRGTDTLTEAQLSMIDAGQYDYTTIAATEPGA